MSRLYTYSVKQEKSPVFFENMNVKKLRDLREVLESLKAVLVLFQVVGKHRDGLEAGRLRGLTGFADKEKGGLVPEFESIIREFEGVIDWSQLGRGKDVDHVPAPNGGADPEYDQLGGKMKEVQKQLEDELGTWRDFFGDSSINYAHKKYVPPVPGLTRG